MAAHTLVVNMDAELGNCIEIIRRKKEGNVLFNGAVNTFFSYGYMASNIW